MSNLEFDGSKNKVVFDKPFDGEPILPGRRKYKLTKVKECPVAKWMKTSEGWRKSKTEKVRGLRFVYKDVSRKAWIWEDFEYKAGENSSLAKVLREMYGESFPKLTYRRVKEWKIVEPESKYFSLALDLVDKTFELDVVQKGERFFNIKYRHQVDPDDIDFSSGNVGDMKMADTSPAVEVDLSSDVDDIAW